MREREREGVGVSPESSLVPISGCLLSGSLSAFSPPLSLPPSLFPSVHPSLTLCLHLFLHPFLPPHSLVPVYFSLRCTRTRLKLRGSFHRSPLSSLSPSLCPFPLLFHLSPRHSLSPISLLPALSPLSLCFSLPPSPPLSLSPPLLQPSLSSLFLQPAHSLSPSPT
jgi:hypothetical protein